jgi:hypothetical protein
VGNDTSEIGLTNDVRHGDVLVGSSERRGFAVFGFSGRWNLALGRGKRQLQETNLQLGGSKVGDL